MRRAYIDRDTIWRTAWASAIAGVISLLLPIMCAQAAPPPALSEQIAAAKSAMMTHPEEALLHARQAKRLAAGIEGGTTAVLEVAWLEGEALTRLNRPAEAAPVLSEALRSVERTNPGSVLHGNLLKAFAAAARVTEDTTAALRSLHKAHAIFSETREKRSEAMVLQNLGMLHFEANDLDRAQQYFDQADASFSGDLALLVSSHTNRGRIHQKRGDVARSIDSYERALAVAERMDSSLLKSRVLTNLSFALFENGEVERAEKTANRALTFSNDGQAGDDGFLRALKARIALLRGNEAEALHHVEAAFRGVDTVETPNLYIEAHEIARMVYEANGMPADALKHFKAYDRLREEGTRIAARANTALMSARFDDANRNAKIARLEADQLRTDRELAKKKLLLERFAVGGLLLLAFMITAYGAHRSAASRKRHREIAKINEKLVYSAAHDSLTGLANRTRCYAVLSSLLSGDERRRGPVYLLLVDLDEFKDVNDTLGHQAGDQVLQVVSSRMADILKEGDDLARLGGDEFAIVVTSASDDQALETYARRVIAEVTKPVPLPEGQVHIGCSIGSAIANAGLTDPDKLFRNADLALYAAKDAGRGQHRAFDPSLLEAAKTRRQLLGDLKLALSEGQLSVFYQPIVCAQTHRLLAYEALLRWDHPKLGPISPAIIIPLAEDSGLIVEIGAWVLRTACEAAMHWDDDVGLAVNVSPLQFNNSLSARVMNTLATTGLPPSRLQLEVTESVFLKGGERTNEELSRLDRMGVSLALDDFGTGYSSLGYLHRAAFDKIKIDRSFVTQAGSGCRQSIAIIRAIIALANSLEMVTTAEGIETEEEAALLRGFGCTQFQGYLFGKPAPVASCQAIPTTPMRLVGADARQSSAGSGAGGAELTGMSSAAQ